MEPPSGPTPEGIQQAAQRLQEFIDALIALNDLTEAMKLRGITNIMIAGRSISLASLQQAASFLAATGGRPTAGQVFDMYYTGAGWMGAGLAMTAVGATMVAKGNPAGLALISLGEAMFFHGVGIAGQARQYDIQFYGGRILGYLDPVTRAFLMTWFAVFGIE